MSQHLAARATALLSARLAPRIDLTCGGRQAARADIILRVKAQELALASRGCFPTAALDGEAGREAKVEPWQETAKAGDGGRQARRISLDFLSVCPLAHPCYLSVPWAFFQLPPYVFDPFLSYQHLAASHSFHS
jgi:hypothetical protein